jgi:AcrR family transcriptional regulator
LTTGNGRPELPRIPILFSNTTIFEDYAQPSMKAESKSTKNEPDHHSARGRQTRSRLLVAGKRVFERDGFLQARITDIAAEAGVSHGSFYHYFETKEAIFREIAEGIEVQLLSMNDAEYKDYSDPVDRIGRI